MNIPASLFNSMLVNENGLHGKGFAFWQFEGGMLFGAGKSWWGKRSVRQVPHEGLDIYSFETISGRRGILPVSSRIPFCWPGRIVRIMDDFLGKSVFVKHAFNSVDGALHSIYGHITPAPGLKEGTPVSEQGLIGTLSNRSSGQCPPHLHLSIAFIPESVSSADLSWKAISDPRVCLVDPLELFPPDKVLMP